MYKEIIKLIENGGVRAEILGTRRQNPSSCPDRLSADPEEVCTPHNLLPADGTKALVLKLTRDF